MDLDQFEMKPIFLAIQRELSLLRQEEVQFRVRERKDRPYSTIVFFDVFDRKGVQNLMLKKLIKTPAFGPVGVVDAKAEFEALKFLHAKYEKVSGCSVPKPILSLLQFDAFVMEAYDVPLVQDYWGFLKYFSRGDSFNDLKRHVYLIGLWLRHFQNFMMIHPGHSDNLLPFFEDCGLRLKKLLGSGSKLISPDLYDRVMFQLAKLMKAVSGEDIPMVAGHGDFGPYNILATSKGIIVIDFSTYGESPVCRDPLQMLILLKDQYQNPFQSRRKIAELEEMFCEGYGRKPNVPRAVSAICEIHERLVKLCGAIFPDGNWNRKFEQNAIAKTHVSWLRNEESRNYLW